MAERAGEAWRRLPTAARCERRWARPTLLVPMSQITITLPDGSRRSVDAGTPVRDVAAAISPRLEKAALAAVVDDRLVDLSYPLAGDASVRIVTAKSPEAMGLVRHSTAHLVAAAVSDLF